MIGHASVVRWGLIAFLLLGCHWNWRGAAVAAAETTTIRSTSISGRKYVLLRDVASYYNLTYKKLSNGVELSSKYSKILLYDNKRGAVINGVPVTLNFVPLLTRGNRYLSYNDFINTLDPIMRKAALTRHKVRTIVIDPGHGGKAAGAVGKFSQEKNNALVIAKKLKAKLEKLGYKVLLTRSTDVDLALTARPALAKKWKADLFISLHNNSSTDLSVRGIETFSLTPLGAPGSYNKNIEKEWVAGDKYTRNNQALAFYIQKGLISRTGAENRGVKRARFVVLRDASCPAVLIEMGFISNVSDEKNLNSRVYQEKLLQGIVDGIVNYRNRVE